MAIQFTQDAKNRIAHTMAQAMTAGSQGNNILIFPNTVAFPSAYILTVVTGGAIRFDGVFMTRTNNRFSSNVKTATSSVNATLGWFMINNVISGLTANIANGRFISDSIGLSGSGSLLTVNTMDITPGTILTAQFNLSII